MFSLAFFASCLMAHEKELFLLRALSICQNELVCRCDGFECEIGLLHGIFPSNPP